MRMKYPRLQISTVYKKETALTAAYTIRQQREQNLYNELIIKLNNRYKMAVKELLP